MQLNFLNQQLVETSSKNIVLPYNKEHLEILEKRVDDEGNFYLLSRLYQKGRVNRRKGTPNYEYILMVYKNQNIQALTYHLSVDDYLLTDLKFNLLKEGTVILAGLISDAGNAKTNGICYFKAD